MTTPALQPQREAIKLAQLWRTVHGETFPIQAAALAIEWSKQVVPDCPIAEVLPQDLKGFEGGLFRLDKRNVWVVLYQEHQGVPGRSNFTVAHEFGHYVLHRNLQQIFQCSQDATLGVGKAKIEREADLFASYLLMPIDDFRRQVGAKRMTFDLIGRCADRYSVSLTAAILKWLEFTEQAAVVVIAREGMINWWRASTSAKWRGLRNIREGMELPLRSLAFDPGMAISAEDFRVGVEHPPGVWFDDCAAREMVIISDRYDMTISLLVLDTPGVRYEEEPDDDMTTQLPSF